MRRVAYLTAVLAGSFCGCGTVTNVTPTADEPAPLKVYGGVAMGAKASWERLLDTEGGHGGLLALAVEKTVLLPYLVLIDLPCSAVGDTLTLPVTLQAAIRRGKEQRQTGAPDATPGRDAE